MAVKKSGLGKGIDSLITDKVKNVNINENFDYPTFKNRVMSSSLDMVNSSESINISPINTEEIIKINTNFVLDCK